MFYLSKIKTKNAYSLILSLNLLTSPEFHQSLIFRCRKTSSHSLPNPSFGWRSPSTPSPHSSLPAP